MVYGSKAFIGWHKAGIVAGSARKSCIAFLVSMHDNADIVSSVNAFTRGVQSVLGPDERVHVMDIGGWCVSATVRCILQCLPPMGRVQHQTPGMDMVVTYFGGGGGGALRSLRWCPDDYEIPLSVIW